MSCCDSPTKMTSQSCHCCGEFLCEVCITTTAKYSCASCEAGKDLHCSICFCNFEDVNHGSNGSFAKICDACNSVSFCSNKELSTFERLDNLEDESLYMSSAVFDRLETLLTDTSRSVYVPRRTRDIILDILNKLEEDTPDVTNLRKILSISTVELPYISKLKRHRLFRYISKWRPVLVERGNQAKNKFMLRNGHFTEAFRQFKNSRKWICGCYNLFKRCKEDGARIEFVLEEKDVAKLRNDLKEFEPAALDPGIEGLEIIIRIGNNKYYDTNFKYGDSFMNCFGDSSPLVPFD
mmetsp:Transcript_9493/g.14187  ORF Transcript_9493/g.14187 Transcript_9493/m.14187 type:complete len:294 (-) Transcript_9493:161-1042(-)